MKNPLQALFAAGLLPKTDFPPESRYHGIAVKTLAGPDGEAIAYLARRLPPAPERFETLSVHRVRAGDRLDRMAAALAGDAERFWFLCDVNGAIWPEELEEEGRLVRTTLPADVPAPKDEA